MVVGDAGSPPPADTAVQARLLSQGYLVTLISDDNVTPGDAAGMALVYISATADSNIVGTTMRNMPTPVMVSESNLYDDMGMTGPTPGVDYGYTDSLQTAVNIIDPGHPLAGGFSGSVTVYTAQNQMRWGNPNGNAALVGISMDGFNRGLLFGYENGAPMFGLNAPARRIGFFFSATTGANLNANGWALFDAAVSWGTQ